jgi:hypothetical protein
LRILKEGSIEEKKSIDILFTFSPKMNKRVDEFFDSLISLKIIETNSEHIFPV